MIRGTSAFFAGLLALAFITLGAAGCTTLSGTQLQGLPSATAPAASPTPTILWFPPSITPSPQFFPTRAPTPEQKPGVGALLLGDDFSSASEWNTSISDQASITVSDSQLTIAVQPGLYAFSLRHTVTFANFYAELTARPSLCRDTDDYGLLFRAPNNVASYRFSLACNGTAGVERVSIGSPRILQAPIPSGDVPPGAPGEVRLGVWAVGSEFHFFLNGHYQFSVDDRNYPSGAIGVFAHAAGATPVTVTFSDLAVYEVNYVPPTVTPRP